MPSEGIDAPFFSAAPIESTRLLDRSLAAPCLSSGSSLILLAMSSGALYDGRDAVWASVTFRTFCYKEGLAGILREEE